MTCSPSLQDNFSLCHAPRGRFRSCVHMLPTCRSTNEHQDQHQEMGLCWAHLGNILYHDVISRLNVACLPDLGIGAGRVHDLLHQGHIGCWSSGPHVPRRDLVAVIVQTICHKLHHATLEHQLDLPICWCPVLAAVLVGACMLYGRLQLASWMLIKERGQNRISHLCKEDINLGCHPDGDRRGLLLSTIFLASSVKATCELREGHFLG